MPSFQFRQFFLSLTSFSLGLFFNITAALKLGLLVCCLVSFRIGARKKLQTNCKPTQFQAKIAARAEIKK